MAPDAHGTRRLARFELVALTTLILSYTWLWQGLFPGDFVLCVVLYLAIGFAGQLGRGEGMREIGLRTDNLGPALALAASVIGPLALATLLLGGVTGSWDYGGPAWFVRAIVGGTAWGLLQQYGLVAVYYRRYHEVLGNEGRATWAAAATFALFHLPNPFLTLLGVGLGALACWMWRRVPNLWALGLSHGLLSMVLLRSLPDAWTFRFRVGPSFFPVLERLRDQWTG